MTFEQRRSSDEKSGETRADLLTATTRIINASGPAAATSRAIAEEAQVNLGSITYYFGSKDALVAEALAETGRRLLVPVIEALTNADSPIEQLLRAAQLLPEILSANPEALRGYVQALAAATNDPVVHGAIAELHRDMANLLAEQILSHQASGIVPGWVDPPAMAAVLVSLVDGIAVNAAVGLSDIDPATAGAQFAAILLHASLPGRQPEKGALAQPSDPV